MQSALRFSTSLWLYIFFCQKKIIILRKYIIGEQYLPPIKKLIFFQTNTSSNDLATCHNCLKKAVKFRRSQPLPDKLYTSRLAFLQSQLYKMVGALRLLRLLQVHPGEVQTLLQHLLQPEVCWILSLGLRMSIL